jgi:alpha-glucosidase
MVQLDLGRRTTPAQTTPGTFEGIAERDARSVTLRFERASMRLVAAGHGILRLRLAPEHRFAPRRSWAVAAADDTLEGPELELRDTPEALEVRAGAITARVHRAGGAVELEHARGVRFGADLGPPSWREVTLADTTIMARPGDALPPGRSSLQVSARKRMAPGEAYLGLGQRTGSLDRRGRVLSNWNIDEPSLGHTRLHDNFYQAHPVLMAVRPELSWGLFLNVTSYSQFDLGASDLEELRVRALGGELDTYIFAGPTPAEVIEQLTRLTGRPALPPMWALGFHQSRWGYRSDSEMRELVAEFRARGIGLDAIHFDIDYMRDYRDFTWDPERFPDPEGLVTSLGEQGVRVVTIIDPGVRHELGRGYRPAEEGLLTRRFVERDDGSPFSGYCWPDAALFPDFARADVRAWWGALHEESHVDVGVAGVWNDMNEPSIFERPFSEGFSDQAPMPLAIEHGDDHERAPHAEVHNAYGLLMSRATYEGLVELRPEIRPWVLTRSAFTGIQRYAASWMGDNCSWWEHLQLSFPQLGGMGLSGSPFVGVDIGGFAENCGPELFARWIEAAIVYPFMRVHSGVGTARQEPWALGPEVEEIARRMIALRYRLLPYLYTLAHESAQTGAPLLRPMPYAYPELAELYSLDDQVILGPNLLFAPITAPGRAHRMVSFPPGAWYDLHSGELVTDARGVSHQVVHAPLGRPALFARGIIPLGNARQSTAEPITELELAVFPTGDDAFTLIEDDGETTAYARGERATRRLHASRYARGVEIAIAPREGTHVPPARELAVRAVLAEPPVAAEVDGVEVPATWDEVTRSATVRLEDDGRGHRIRFSSSIDP